MLKNIQNVFLMTHFFLFKKFLSFNIKKIEYNLSKIKKLVSNWMNSQDIYIYSKFNFLFFMTWHWFTYEQNFRSNKLNINFKYRNQKIIIIFEYLNLYIILF